MIIDGVAASEAIDSSGEILDVKGCDISDLEEGRGVLNFEHKGEHDAGASFNDIIGRIIFAKKIFEEKDCANERESFYWREVKLPFIYIQCELFDQDGHKGAESAAAMIRHYHKRQLPILVRYSIEGVTVQKENNRLVKCIAKRVAATIKPCNKSCHSGVLEDPTEGFEAKLDETPDPIEELVDQAGAKKFEHPEYTKLGGVHEIELATPELVKTLTAGNYNVAPGNLVGGAALQVSELSQRHNFLKAQALAAYRDWDKRTDFRSFVKMRLLDVDPSFIDHFVNLVEDYHKIKLNKAEQGELDLKPPPGDVRPNFPANQPVLDAVKNRKPEQKPIKRDGIKVLPTGKLITQKHELQVHLPDLASKDSPYFQILYPHKSRGLKKSKKLELLNKVHKPWLRAMGNWMILNDMLRAGTLPEPVVYSAGMFSAMSPNTSIPLQELYYGHVVDMMHRHGFDPRDPVHESHVQYLKDMISGQRLPEWNRDFYKERGHEDNPDSGHSTSNDPPQILAFENYNAFHPHMMELIRQHRDDGQQMSASLMHMKNLAQRAAKNRKSVQHPTMTGFGIKLARYMLGMMGAGNVLVPDRHFLRALFNVHPRDSEKLSHLTNVFEESTAEKTMRALDQFFFEHHPAVQYTLSKFPEHFAGREHQAIFPAFWLHWLATPHYEEMQGMPNANSQNAGTDHMPYWHSIAPHIEQIMRKYGVDFNEGDTDFNFGANIQKKETTQSLGAPQSARCAHAMKEIEGRFGQTAAHFAFHCYMTPALLKEAARLKKPDLSQLMMKAQSLTVDLSKALADFKNANARNVYKLYDTSDEKNPRLIGRFAIHDDQIHILEDSGPLAHYFDDGIVTQRVLDSIDKLKHTDGLKLTTTAEENAERYDQADEQPIPKLPARAKAYYEFRISGLNTKHVIEVDGNRVKYDNRSLTEDEIHEIMENVKSGLASLRILPSPNMINIANMEQDMTNLAKAIPGKQEIPELQEEFIDKHAADGMDNKLAWDIFKEKPKEGIYAEINANDIGWLNKEHGYDVGDKSVRLIGKTIKETAPSKAKLFRGSGDTFHLWMPSAKDLSLFCRQLRSALEQIPSIGGTHNLSVCVGVGNTPESAHKAQVKAKKAKYAVMQTRFQPGQMESHFASEVPGDEGEVPFEQLPPLIKKHEPPTGPTYE